MSARRKYTQICEHQLVSSECPDCRRVRANAAQLRHHQRYNRWYQLALLVADVIGPLPDEELQALMEHQFGGPLRPPHPNARTCAHGQTPMCAECRRQRRNRLNKMAAKRRKWNQQCEGGIDVYDPLPDAELDAIGR